MSLEVIDLICKIQLYGNKHGNICECFSYCTTSDPDLTKNSRLKYTEYHL